MSPFLFAEAIESGKPLKVFNNGDMIRDFTYIDDIAEGTLRILAQPPAAATCPNGVPYRIFNVGCSHPVRLMDFIAELEKALGKTAVKEFVPMQEGDVYQTYADTRRLEAATGFRPKTELHEGISRFVAWYQSPENPLR